ncbi:MAG: hypothetical protein LBT98_00585 [Puniceicoccales bacterium]|jgi:predicted dehydrogenase|nr:hypothetical protein [Puniceicoccales bacterium]
MAFVPERIALVGGGNMGLRHGNFCQKLWPGAPVAVLSRHCRPAAFPALASPDALLHWNPSLAIVANAAIDHCSSALPLLRAGIPTLIEKPLSHSAAVAAQFLRALGDTLPAPASVGFHLIHRRGFARLGRWLQEGILGKIFSVRTFQGHALADWRPGDPTRSVSARERLGGGILREQCHDLALLSLLFGLPRSVLCRSWRVGSLSLAVADSAQLILDLGGFPGEVHLDMVALRPRRVWEIQGERGEIRWDLRADALDFFGRWERRSFVGRWDGCPSAYELQLLDFAEKIDRRDRTADALRRAGALCRLVDAAELSDREGRSISLEDAP